MHFVIIILQSVHNNHLFDTLNSFSTSRYMHIRLHNYKRIYASLVCFYTVPIDCMLERHSNLLRYFKSSIGINHNKDKSHLTLLLHVLWKYKRIAAHSTSIITYKKCEMTRTKLLKAPIWLHKNERNLSTNLFKLKYQGIQQLIEMS